MNSRSASPYDSEKNSSVNGPSRTSSPAENQKKRSYLDPIKSSNRADTDSSLEFEKYDLKVSQ
mgnify:CR=1 FL=1